jgi:hypothetical protein
VVKAFTTRIGRFLRTLLILWCGTGPPSSHCADPGWCLRSTTSSAGYRSPETKRPRVVVEPMVVHHIRSSPGRRRWQLASSTRTAGPASWTSSTRRSLGDPPRAARAQGPCGQGQRLAPERALLAPPSRAAARSGPIVSCSFPRLCPSGLRGPRWRLRLADDERAPLQPLRSSWFRQPLPPHARPSGATEVGLATAGEADRRGPYRGPRLALPGWHREAHPVRPAELAADHPVGSSSVASD